MKKYVVFFFLILSFQICLGATGKIFGIVRSQKSGEPLQMAAVKISSLQKGTYSDKTGKFVIMDVPTGEYEVSASMIGYKTAVSQVEVKAGITAKANFNLEIEAVSLSGKSVSANRAVKRETPIAFTNIEQEEISDKYTTEDMPQILDDVPGLFSNTTGMGDAEITMRGFEADKIQVLINGIPVNDPESQKVYWSNWTGLTSNVKSVQVQKGAGSSLYGSGAFGGSLNIETIGATQYGETTVRTSYTGYATDGDVADGQGNITSYNPYNYNLLFRFSSGALYGGIFNYNLMVERKVGDYYIEGTNYRGWSFGFDTQTVIGDHKLSTSFMGAPQSHNQVYFKSDPKLMDTLGREYNRNNHEYQKNYYFKPQFSLRDQWDISENQVLMTNLFFTKGDGGGKYLNQDRFDIETGKLYFRDDFLDADNPQAFEDTEFGQHALYLYNNYGYISHDFCPSDTVMIGPIPVVGPTYKGKLIGGEGADFFQSRYDYSWRNNNISDHMQYGLNTYYDETLNDKLDMVVGGELRFWEGNHIGKRELFRHYQPSYPNNVETYETMEKNYDYTTHVLNMSGFARFNYKPIEKMNILLDGQIARYASEVEENPIEIYDLGTGLPTGLYYKDTEDLTVVVNGDTIPKFDDDDYKKVYSFFSPKMGVNYNLSEYLSLRTNYSIAYKEPRTSEWYGYDGPDTRQLYTKNIVETDSLGNYYNVEEEHFYGELKPERINTLEFGMGVDNLYFEPLDLTLNFDANVYISDYTDKIESVYIPVSEEYYNAQEDSIEINEFDAGLVINAGKARHQGLELSANGKSMGFDGAASLTLSRNRWTEMNVEEIFDTSAEDMKNKVVPYSPEVMLDGSLGYTYKLSETQSFRCGLNGKFWDGYYANYTNEYFDNYKLNTSSGEYEPDSTSIKSSKLPYFLEFGLDLKYSFKIYDNDAFVKLGCNNLLNRENYSSATVRSDYNRGYFNDEGEFVDDYLTGNEYMYVTPAPLLNVYLTMELKF